MIESLLLKGQKLFSLQGCNLEVYFKIVIVLWFKLTTLKKKKKLT